MKDKITKTEIMTNFFMICSSPFLGIGFYNLIKIANIDSIISIILAFIFSFVVLFIYIKINNYNITLDIFDKIKLLFNSINHKLIIGILSISFFILSSCMFYNIDSFIITEFFDETYFIIIGILLCILITYIVCKGINTILKTGNILFYIICVLLIIEFFGNYRSIDLSNLKPVLSNGLINPLKGSISIILFNIIYLFLFLMIPKDKINLNKHFNLCLIISNILLFTFFLTITIYTISILGINLSSMYEYPIYMSLRGISIFGFINRIENFIIIYWIFEVFMLLSLTTYFISKALSIRPIIITSSIFTFTVLFFKNITFYNEFITNYLYLFSTLIILVFTIIALKNKKMV